MPPGVSVISRNKPLETLAFPVPHWHHKWACPPRCMMDSNICCSPLGAIQQSSRWTLPLVMSLKQGSALYTYNPLRVNLLIWWMQYGVCSGVKLDLCLCLKSSSPFGNPIHTRATRRSKPSCSQWRSGPWTCSCNLEPQSTPGVSLWRSTESELGKQILLKWF